MLDPTIKQGYPLWRGYRNWEPTPGIATTNTPSSPPRGSFFDDFLYWAQRPGAFRLSLSSKQTSNVHVPVQAVLHLVCAEWLTMADYIKTRLGQIDWEIAFPEHFLDKSRGHDVNIALKKLHVWRRLVPLYREMLTETLHRVFRFPCHTIGLIDDNSSTNGISNGGPTDEHQQTHVQEVAISAFRNDFDRALSYMNEYQERIDRLTSVVAAVISIADSRRGLVENRNLARLTWLATFYIPLSFVAALFSMQVDITVLGKTIKWYFAAALPLAVISLGLVFTLTLPGVQRWVGQVKDVLTRFHGDGNRKED